MTTHVEDAASRIAAARPRVVVVGDPLVDGWIYGDSERLAREAPAPIVTVSREDRCAGGAANTARNLAALGARVSMVGIVGDDDAGHLLAHDLAAAGVDIAGLIFDGALTTVTKERIVSGGQILARLDHGANRPPSEEAARAAAAAMTDLTMEADAEVVCDYGGAARPALREAMTSRARRPSLTVVDSHELSPWRELRPDLVTPNIREAARAIGEDHIPVGDRATVAASWTQRLLSASGASAAVVTLDAEGSVVLTGSGATHRTHARPAPEQFASGAGDSFAAGLVAAMASGMSLVESAEVGQAAADVAVSRPGTSVCSSAELKARLTGEAGVYTDASELALVLKAEREAGRRVVFTNGCFDVLHRGHTGFLKEAAGLGDVLVVALNGDDSVRRLKGSDRPINPLDDRVSVIASLDCVDYVTSFDEDTPMRLLAALAPDVFVRAGGLDHRSRREADVVTSYGGSVEVLRILQDHSTSAIVERIRGERRNAAASRA